MIGIDPTEKRGFVAAFQDRRPVLLGEGKSTEELVGIARSNLGDSCLTSTAVVAVPAWANDEQRKRVFDRAKAAGLTTLRLVNRPSAVALAYFALVPAERSTVLILEVEESSFDVTVLAKSSTGFDVLSVDGNAQINPLTASDPDKLFAEIKAAILRVLKQAVTKPQTLSDILCAGRSDRIKLIQPQLIAAFGRQGSTDIRPEHAAALGGAVQAGLLERRRTTS